MFFLLLALPFLLTPPLARHLKGPQPLVHMWRYMGMWRYVGQMKQSENGSNRSRTHPISSSTTRKVSSVYLIALYMLVYMVYDWVGLKIGYHSVRHARQTKWRWSKGGDRADMSYHSISPIHSHQHLPIHPNIPFYSSYPSILRSFVRSFVYWLLHVLYVCYVLIYLPTSLHIHTSTHPRTDTCIRADM